MRVLVVCSANQCRSPMAEVLLRRALPAAEVRSAGTSYEPGVAAARGSLHAMARRGLSLDDHVSRRVDPATVAEADLVLGMAREHVREVVVAQPQVFCRTFTLKELVRRGEAAGPRRPGRSLADWLDEVGEGRRPADLLGSDPADDIVDPIGGPDDAFERVAQEIEDLTRRLARLVA